MSNRTTPIPVVFRKFDDGSVIALMPSLNHESGATNYGRIMSYMHVGQHDEASPDLTHVTARASQQEYQDLLDELKMIGYDVVVRDRLNYRYFVAKARAEKEKRTDL